MSITQARSPDSYVAIAKIARPHGVRGELRVTLFNPESSMLGRGRKVFVRRAAAQSGLEPFTVGAVREANDALLLYLDGVVDRNAADALRGAELLVPRDDLPALEEDEFYAVDLEGGRAELESGALIGTIKAVVEYPTCQVLVVLTPSGETKEFPLVDDVIGSVDTDKQLVRIKDSAEAL